MDPHPPPAPYPNEPPPKYEPPKGAYPQAAPGSYPQPYFPDQPGSYQQGPTVSQPVFVVRQMGFGPKPCEMQCPYCQAYIRTATEYRTGTLTWLVSGLLCLFGCWMGCCLLPFCIEDMQDVMHHCPNCNKVVGVCQRLV